MCPCSSLRHQGPALRQGQGIVKGLQAVKSRTRRLAAFPEGIDSLLTSGTLITSSLCVLGSAALAVRDGGPPPEIQTEDTDGLNVEYGIMGVVSCIPLVNWTVRRHYVHGPGDEGYQHVYRMCVFLFNDA